MDYCDFCDQSVKEKQGVYENESVIVIYPQKPIIPQHFIIFPKRHTQFISDLSDKESADLKNAVQKIFLVYKNEENCLGFNLTSNNGPIKVGQTVAHAHIHLHLRFENEKYSPYKIMADSSLRDDLSPEQWQQQKELSKSILNK